MYENYFSYRNYGFKIQPFQKFDDLTLLERLDAILEVFIRNMWLYFKRSMKSPRKLPKERNLTLLENTGEAMLVKNDKDGSQICNCGDPKQISLSNNTIKRRISVMS